MPRIGMYIKSIRVTDGVVSSKKPKSTWKYLESRPMGKFKHYIPSWLLQPGEVVDFKASQMVVVHTLHRDEETGKVYDLKQTFKSENIIQCEVREYFKRGSTAYVFADLLIM